MSLYVFYNLTDIPIVMYNMLYLPKHR